MDITLWVRYEKTRSFQKSMGPDARLTVGMALPSAVLYPFCMFGRLHPRHQWQAIFAVQEAKSPADFKSLSQKVICANWRIDQRVSSDREQNILTRPEFVGVATPQAWHKARRDHFKQTLCLPANPMPGFSQSAYRQQFNDGNIIARNKIAPHDQLVHVGSVTSMLWRIAKLDDEDNQRKFRSLFGRSIPSQRVHQGEKFVTEASSLCDAIAREGPGRIKDLAGFLMEALGNSQPPWWACFAREIHRQLKLPDWFAICRSLGLGHLEKGERLLLWRYPVSAVEFLYRPTAVEAHESPYHFPSPPSSAEGICMHLDPAEARCLREVMHEPPSPERAKEYCSGNLGLGIVAETLVSDHSNTLFRSRELHRAKLRKEFSGGADVLWLNTASQPSWP